MIDFLRSLRSHTAYGQRLSGFLAAFLVAELFYKFHSFTLECAAFLVTWLVFDWLLEKILGTPKSKLSQESHSV
jgi:hypothetical protein